MHAYEAALTIADALEADVSATSSTAKIVERTLLLQRASLASSVCSLILQRKVRLSLLLSCFLEPRSLSSRCPQGELSRSVAPAMQAMRLGTRALNNMSRLAPSPVISPPATDSTFSAPPVDHKTALADAAPINKRKAGTTLPGGGHAGLSWQLSEVRPLPRTSLFASQSSCSRRAGSARLDRPGRQA